MPTPIHIQGTVSARRMTRSTCAGWKLGASPTTFIARETQSSPPVPATTIKKNKTKSRTGALLRSLQFGCFRGRGRIWTRPPDDKDAQADHCDSGPAQGRDPLAEHQVA